MLDNLPTHKTKVMEEFFERNPKVRFHFPPTYSSWLKQVELWLAIVDALHASVGVLAPVREEGMVCLQGSLNAVEHGKLHHPLLLACRIIFLRVEAKRATVNQLDLR